MKLDEVTQVYAVVSHNLFLHMINLSVLLVLLNSCLSGTPNLSNVGLPTLAGYAINILCFQAKVILDGPEETGDLPRWEAYKFDVMFR
jgi:hypothetical protein